MRNLVDYRKSSSWEIFLRYDDSPTEKERRERKKKMPQQLFSVSEYRRKARDRLAELTAFGGGISRDALPRFC